MHRYARDHLRLASERQKKNYELKADAGGYHLGDAVWLHNPMKRKGYSPKLQRPWDGPYVVTTRLSDVTYRIQKGAKTKPRIVHYNRLKQYNGENPPTWLMSTPPDRKDSEMDDAHFMQEQEVPSEVGQELEDSPIQRTPKLRRSQRSHKIPSRFDEYRCY